MTRTARVRVMLRVTMTRAVIPGCDRTHFRVISSDSESDGPGRDLGPRSESCHPSHAIRVMASESDGLGHDEDDEGPYEHDGDDEAQHSPPRLLLARCRLLQLLRGGVGALSGVDEAALDVVERAALLPDERGEVSEDLVHVVDRPLDIPDSLLPLDDERLAEVEVVVRLQELLRPLAVDERGPLLVVRVGRDALRLGDALALLLNRRTDHLLVALEGAVELVAELARLRLVPLAPRAPALVSAVCDSVEVLHDGLGVHRQQLRLLDDPVQTLPQVHCILGRPER
eukprot:CAMPEP_0172212850 /NCGR_PEP_ID=MMETSP1050-20130122/37264_1 /TAXON_ID=233186 /ORGANISM="Cryptomonas curvata, Strain CCAP979/52" /LENGTH=284 /DNA_ID=CAMNT_0012893613 /DNA_START=21 /DNA_END=875 /DNA_ORIENTATION=+